MPFSNFKPLHIGKKSGGWEFYFQGYKEQSGVETFSNGTSLFEIEARVPSLSICSVQDWKDFMKVHQGVILNEYGDQLTYEEFWDMVAKNAPGKESSTGVLKSPFSQSIHRTYSNDGDEWTDKEGFSFCARYFS